MIYQAQKTALWSCLALWVVFLVVDVIFYTSADVKVRNSSPLYKFPFGGVAAYLQSPCPER